MYNYTTYGFVIASVLPLPELLPAADGAAPDVTLQIGAVPKALENAVNPRPFLQIAPNEFLLRIKDTASVYVRDGREITVEPMPDMDLSRLRLFLLGSVFGALLLQRGYLVLHGAAVMIGGQGVLLTGKSTAGKSTLAAALHQRGHAILTDDVCAVRLGEDQAPIIQPGFPSLKLWRDSADRLQTSIAGLTPIMPEHQKYRIGVARYHAEPACLRQMYVLSAHDEPTIRIEPVTGMARLDALVGNTYRYFYLKGLGLKAGHFRQCAAVAPQVRVFRVLRPKDAFTIDALAAAVEQSVSEAKR